MNARQFVMAETERNFAFAQAGEEATRERLHNIDDMPSPLQKMGELLLFRTAAKHPKLISSLLNIYDAEKLPGGYEYLGAGSQHTVIANDEQVLKVHRASTYMTAKERRELLAKSEFKHSALVHYLGEMVLKQQAEIGVNPLRPQSDAVILTQRRVDFKNPDFFPAYRRDVNLTSIKKYSHDREVFHELNSLVRNGIAMGANIGMAPDTSGLNNIVLPLDKNRPLLCMDGLPIDKLEDPRGYGRVMDQLVSAKRILFDTNSPQAAA